MRNLLYRLFNGKHSQKELLNESKVFCMAPWVNMHVSTMGQIFPCCLSAHYLDGAIGDVRHDTLKQSWNSDKMKALRKNMLSEKPSRLCDQCYRYEKLGGTSSRMTFNKDFKRHFHQVGKTDNEGHLKTYELKYIDFRFSNLCNFSCRICSHRFSSSWFKEAAELGLADPSKGRLIIPTEDVDGFWEQMLLILPHIERIHFAGGEPLIMEEHNRILNYLIDNGLTDVQLSYNTNFSETKFKGQDVLSQWKHFKHLSVSASLDGMGKRGEFMRKGQDWQKTEHNRIRMIEECPHVGFELTPTVGILNVIHIPDFIENWIDRGLLEPKKLTVYLIFEPHFYNIQNLPSEFKKRVEQRYAEFFKSCRNKLSKDDSEHVKAQFMRIINHMNNEEKFETPDNSYAKETFMTFNQKLDRYRNEDLVEVFPELADLYSID